MARTDFCAGARTRPRSWNAPLQGRNWRRKARGIDCRHGCGGLWGFIATSKLNAYLERNRLSTLPPFVAQRLRLVATILVPADQVRNSNNAVVRPPYCIRFARELRGHCHVLLRNTGPRSCNVLCREELHK